MEAASGYVKASRLEKTKDSTMALYSVSMKAVPMETAKALHSDLKTDLTTATYSAPTTDYPMETAKVPY